MKKTILGLILIIMAGHAFAKSGDYYVGGEFGFIDDSVPMGLGMHLGYYLNSTLAVNVGMITINPAEQVASPVVGIRADIPLYKKIKFSPTAGYVPIDGSFFQFNLSTEIKKNLAAYFSTGLAGNSSVRGGKLMLGLEYDFKR